MKANEKYGVNDEEVMKMKENNACALLSISAIIKCMKMKK